jgi:hypothetical protein
MTYCPRRLIRSMPLFLLALPLAFACIGCAGGTTNLTVTSIQNHQTYQQPFTNAYAGRSEQGDFDVVAVREGPARDGAATVRHVVHVRVLWKPMNGTKLDHPTATNAAIDWYVFDAANPAGLVAYSGAGFVNVQTSGGVATLDIRNATLRPVTREGGMVDPIGPTKLQGTIVARSGRTEQVREILAQTRETIAQANTAAREAARTAAAREASSRAPVEP